MPNASPELRDEMNRLFGDPVDDQGPAQYLVQHGYTSRGGCWSKPPDHLMTKTELLCIQFLVDEWDHALAD